MHWTECDAEAIHGPIFALPPEMISPLVPANKFDSLIQPPAPERLSPPPVEGVPMSRISRDRGGIQQVSYEEPAKPARLPERKPASDAAASVGRTSMGAKRPTFEGKNSQR